MKTVIQTFASGIPTYNRTTFLRSTPSAVTATLTYSIRYC